MKSSSILILSKFLFWVTATYAQVDPEFMFPIRPGEQNYLAGTMGEMRSGHFHAGIDIKTSGVTGLPVYAAANGHVSRIKISTGGYGNAIYIAHPGGKSTVYAHLERYSEDIQRYVRNAQYEKESFEIELFPKKEEFKVSQGDIIGYSGNSGSSTGPHLHFEIRDENQHVIDPLRFGFAEIKDALPPIVGKVALKTLDIDARINNQFGRVLFDVVLVDGAYKILQPIHAQGKIGIQLYAYDRLNGAPNKNGIPCIEMLIDDQVIFAQNIDRVSFSETRSVINHLDYSLWQAVGRKYNKLYVDHGTRLSFLQRPSYYGTFNVRDTITHEVEIRLTDSYDNTRLLTFELNGRDTDSTHGQKVSSYLEYEQFEIVGNTLELIAPSSEQPSNIVLFTDHLAFEITPSLIDHDHAYYLWDLRAGLPDSADLCGQKVQFNFLKTVPPGQEYSYFHDDFQLDFTKRDLYDTLYLRYSYDQDELYEKFHFQNETTPIQSWVKVILHPKRIYDQEKSAVYSINNKGKLSYAGGEWRSDKLVFSTRDFARYTIATDSVAPKAEFKLAGPAQLRCSISDEMSGIKSFRGELNGQWLLMNYDYKRKLLWSEKSEPNNPFKGEFILRVSDNAGNETILKTEI